jgi:hypothetical protein
VLLPRKTLGLMDDCDDWRPDALEEVFREMGRLPAARPTSSAVAGLELIPPPPAPPPPPAFVGMFDSVPQMGIDVEEKLEEAKLVASGWFP